MELTRSSLVASGPPIAFWGYAVTHAVNIPNCTSKTSNTNASPFKLLTGEKPRVISILPFWCQAYAIKPRFEYFKTRMDSRTWVGVNLGRSVRSPSVYHIWIPSANRIVVASDANFNECLYPRRPAASTPLTQHVDADANQPPALPNKAPYQRFVTYRPDELPPARASRRALLLFSGPIARPDGIASPPYSTFLVSRFFDSDSAADGGFPPVRDQNNVMVLPNVASHHAQELARASKVVRRTVSLLRAARSTGAEYILEHPADR
eukprot:4882-Pleurochrysis_carterae.AAC.1